MIPGFDGGEWESIRTSPGDLVVWNGRTDSQCEQSGTEVHQQED